MTIAIELTEAQAAIKDAIERVCTKYDDHYWLKVDESGKFPDAFVNDIAAGGWLGVAMPESVGGAGLGLTEAQVLSSATALLSASHSPAGGVSKVQVETRTLMCGLFLCANADTARDRPR